MLARILIIIFSLNIVVSCKSIRPLYYNNPTIIKETASIEIEPIDTILGAEIYYHLDKLLGAKSESKYLLRIISKSDSTAQLVIADDSDVVKQNVSMEYKYVLLDKESDKELNKGKIRMVGSYDTTTSSYHSFVSEKQLKKDLAETLANEIYMRLLLYFGNN